jgi:indole-3-glycerol phosphate synthase
MTINLNSIIANKKLEVAALHKQLDEQQEHPIMQLLENPPIVNPDKIFKKSLQTSSLAVIAEIKRRSPSKGLLADIDDPIFLAKNYINGGANALSILTDEKFFGGTLADMEKVARTQFQPSIPILRKDFILDEVQIAQSILFGANAILAIVSVLGKKTQSIVTCAKQLGIDVVVEIHNQHELDIALSSGAEIIGINNRNLFTMEVNPLHAFTLVNQIPSHIMKIAESGILSPLLANQYYKAGFNAVLIGEALVKSPSPENFIRACRHV